MNLRKKVVIKKLNEVYKRGYLPSRGDESYRLSFPNGIKYYDVINCVAHACFNLNNDILGKIGLRREEYGAFRDFGGLFYNREKIGRNIFNFIRGVGLKIEPCHEDEKIKFNQWKIATFFDTNHKDMHFMLQERDGRWSSKQGNHENIDYFDEIPKRYNGKYDFCGTFVITNPYVERDINIKDDNLEEKETF